MEMKDLRVRQLDDVVLSKTADGQQLLNVKEEEVPYLCTSGLDQQNPEVLHIKQEEEELWSRQGGELLHVKSEDDEKPQLQLHQIKTEDNRETDPPTSCSAERMKTETDVGDCGGPEPGRNHDPKTHLQSKTDEKALDSPRTEDSDDNAENNDDDDWDENMSSSTSENVDSDEDWRETRIPRPRVKSKVGDKTVKEVISCPQCRKPFVYKQSLQKHMTSHSGETSSNLVDEKQSRKKQAGTRYHEKPFGCDKCGKRFSSKYTLKHHMTGHTGEKSFTCDDCGKTFRSHFHFQLHMRPYWKDIP